MTDRTAPESISRETLLDSLRTISIDGSEPGSLAPYVEQDLDRFLITYNLASIVATEVLEIGANPYFLTILLRWFRPDLSMQLINFFGSGEGTFVQHVSLARSPRDDLADRFDMSYASADIEARPLPFDNERFDLVLFCEVLEHFIVDPYHALLELHRTLKVGGHLLLTTPNVARLENVARILDGHNIYDPYSGHGPHGRHNREYTRHEVAWMLSTLGFEPVNHFTADVHPRLQTVDVEGLPMPPGRLHDLGQYQFHLWKKTSANVAPQRPAWLYRNWPGSLDPRPL